MTNELADYVKDILHKNAKGNATEHTYRESLVTLSKKILSPHYVLTNEPKRQACGAPDYILERDVVPIGFIEAKDVGTSLDKVEGGEQMIRYLDSLDNLILTDYLEFRFFRRGEKIGTVSLTKKIGGKMVGAPSKFPEFIDLYNDFSNYRTQTITNPRILADIMANKARLAKDVFAKILADEGDASSLHDQYQAFKTVLLHEVTSDEFADIYGETLTYGLFTARLHDDTPETFSREEAYKHIPKSNPFLRDLFTYVGTKLDERADWIVDTLCDVFRATDLDAILKSFSRDTGRSDPFLHFYETFLGKYNPKKKRSRGVWYTPEPVVNFIVRGVDELLRVEFKLPQGLADTSTTTIQVDAQAGKKGAKAIKATTVKVKVDVPRVQVLDVATGTGTFLAQIIQHIHGRYKKQQGLWSGYVEEHLIPRLYGFELLMASYAMCHLNLEMLLEETGYKPKSGKQPRLNVYLTNSLQKPDEEVDKLPLIDWFTRESNEASYIKKYAPIMVAIGNPPYSSISSNMTGDLIVDIDDYKYVKGIHFGERKHWLHDDYVKFIRMGEQYVAKNGEGILGYITNHSYLDNPTFRGMRWHLLNTFETIHVIDLHGNTNKSEVPPTGIVDKNVFDIKQGVSIILAVRSKAKKKGELAIVKHHELWGSRQSKYDALKAASLKSIQWKTLKPAEPHFFFVPVSDIGKENYAKGFAIDELFKIATTGIVTMGDGFIVDEFKDVLGKRVRSLSKSNLSEMEFKTKYNLGKNYAKWALETSKTLSYCEDGLVVLGYRPFDSRFTYFDSKLVWRLREKVMKHMINGPNVGLVVPKQAKGTPGGIATKGIVAHKTYDAYNSNSLFPLYLIDEKGKTPVPNLAQAVWRRLKKAGGKLADDPQNVFDYVYAVLHAPQFRTAYAEFMRVDFPRIPFPKSPAYFKDLAELGAKMRNLHLFEDEDAPKSWTAASYPIDGDDQITKVERDGIKIWINDDQYFDDVSDEIWSMQVGGYWPAQKWLQDRKGQILSHNQITYYQSLAGTLGDTISLMEEIDGAYS